MRVKDNIVSHSRQSNNYIFPDNVYDKDGFPYLQEQGTPILALSRTSPDQKGEQRTGEYQTTAIRDFAKRLGLRLVEMYQGIGESGHRIGPKSTPQLYAAIEHARQTGFPIVATNWQRFCREPHKLARFSPVCFVSIEPLSTDPAKLNGLSKREFNRQNPERKGGRPPDMEAPYMLPFIMSRLGQSWRGIANELGDGWYGKKVQRLFNTYFEYIDELK